MDPRILARDLYIEKTNQNAKVQGLFDGMHGFLVKTQSGGIPALSSSTAGKAACKLCMINNDGTVVETSTEVDVYNPFETAIAADTFVTAKVANGANLVVDGVYSSGDLPPAPGGTDCAAVFECFEGRCCEHDATDRCKYKRDAIKSVSLDDGAGRTWRQKGKSAFSSLNDCTFDVQVLDQNCVEATAIVERTANGWKVTVLGDVWESTAGPTECTGEDSGLTKSGGGTGTVKFEHEGECPTRSCCEDLPGSIMPRITISGVPEVLEHSLQFAGTISGFGQTCAGQFYDRLVSRMGAMNGVFYGPAMIENPLGTDFGLVWEDNLNVCLDIEIIDEYYNGGNLSCVNNGIPCSDPQNPGDRSSYSWTQNPTNGQLTFSADAGRWGSIDQITAGAGCFANNGFLFNHVFDPLSCQSGDTWRDYEVVYTDTVRYRFTSDPAVAGQTCFDIEIVADFVEV